MSNRKSIGKGNPIKELKPGQLIGSETANCLIRFYNAFINGKIQRADPSDLFISEKNIIWQVGIKDSGGSDGGSGFQGEYDTAQTYTAGQTFLISSATTIDGISVVAGFYGVPPEGVDVNGLPWSGFVPASPTANAVPQSPLPSLGAAPNDRFYAKLIMPFCV